MIYLGLLIDKDVDGYGLTEKNYQLMLKMRSEALATWPGQKLAEDLICKIC